MAKRSLLVLKCISKKYRPNKTCNAADPTSLYAFQPTRVQRFEIFPSDVIHCFYGLGILCHIMLHLSIFVGRCLTILYWAWTQLKSWHILACSLSVLNASWCGLICSIVFSWRSLPQGCRRGYTTHIIFSVQVIHFKYVFQWFGWLSEGWTSVIVHCGFASLKVKLFERPQRGFTNKYTWLP